MTTEKAKLNQTGVNYRLELRLLRAFAFTQCIHILNTVIASLITALISDVTEPGLCRLQPRIKDDSQNENTLLCFLFVTALIQYFCPISILDCLKMVLCVWFKMRFSACRTC